jgi:hypothetical protein
MTWFLGAALFAAGFVAGVVGTIAYLLRGFDASDFE